MWLPWSKKEKKHVCKFKKEWELDVTHTRTYADPGLRAIKTNAVIVFFRCDCGKAQAKQFSDAGVKRLEPEYAKSVKRVGERKPT